MRLHPRQGALYFCAVSAAMLLSVALCDGLHHLARRDWHSAPHLHLIVLPHGVVVMAAWMYGWPALALLFPAVFLSGRLLVGTMVLQPLVLGLLMVKLITVPLAFDLFRLAGFDARGVGHAANWKVLVAVGLVGSMLGNVPRVMFGPCCVEQDTAARLKSYVDFVAADIAGLMLVLVAVMLVFRVLRHN